MQNLSTKIEIDEFTGPFYVLVELILSKKMDITTVSLAEVTDQYIEAVNSQEGGINPYHLADFLVVAARLIYLKSKMILPYLATSQEEEEIEDLAKRLKVYEKYHQAAKNIEKILKEGKFIYNRDKLAVQVESVFNPPHNLTVFDLKDIWQEIVRRIEPVVKVPEKVIKRTVSIKEKISQISSRLEKYMRLNFNDIIAESKDKTEVIVSFLALLELVKQKAIKVTQNNLYEDIVIERK